VGWTIKPVYGLLSDFFPFVGYQRKGYLLFMSAVGASSWLTLAAFPPNYMLALLFLTLCAATLAFCDVMTDALMVEVGRPLELTGSFQAMQWASISLAFTLAQLAGGYLAAHVTPRMVFLLSAAFPLVTFLLRDSSKNRTIVSRPGCTKLRGPLANGSLTSTMDRRGVLFLWNFSPS
jgi:MFS-type transporter involved in bile tolerance (Atg22 family)